MKIPNRFLVSLLTISMLTLGGCAKNPADSVPAAGVSSTPAAAAGSATPTSTGTPQAAVEGTVYAFAPDTEVGFVGSKVTGSHAGGFKKVTGTVSVPDGNVEKSAVALEIDMTTVYSDDEKLTGHLKGDDFFAVGEYPKASFKSTALSKTDNGYDVQGELTLRGVTKAISFPATIDLADSKMTVQAEFSINRTDFNIVYKGKADNLIRPEVVIKFGITAEQKA